MQSARDLFPKKTLIFVQQCWQPLEPLQRITDPNNYDATEFFMQKHSMALWRMHAQKSMHLCSRGTTGSFRTWKLNKKAFKMPCIWFGEHSCGDDHVKFEWANRQACAGPELWWIVVHAQRSSFQRGANQNNICHSIWEKPSAGAL